MFRDTIEACGQNSISLEKSSKKTLAKESPQMLSRKHRITAGVVVFTNNKQKPEKRKIFSNKKLHINRNG